jgi:hypothetical protein
MKVPRLKDFIIVRLIIIFNWLSTSSCHAKNNDIPSPKLAGDWKEKQESEKPKIAVCIKQFLRRKRGQVYICKKFSSP